MGQVRHGCATTTHAVRAAIQRSQASLAQLSRELGINPKTVAKWRKRATVEDMKTGPTEPRSTVLTATEEAMIVAVQGTVRNSVCGRAADHQAIARVKRSPKMTANWALAMAHSLRGMVHSFSALFKTRNRSLVAASSLGK